MWIGAARALVWRQNLSLRINKLLFSNDPRCVSQRRPGYLEFSDEWNHHWIARSLLEAVVLQTKSTSLHEQLSQDWEINIVTGKWMRKEPRQRQCSQDISFILTCGFWKTSLEGPLSPYYFLIRKTEMLRFFLLKCQFGPVTWGNITLASSH